MYNNKIKIVEDSALSIEESEIETSQSQSTQYNYDTNNQVNIFKGSN